MLAVAAARRIGYNPAVPESIAEYHRRVAAAGSTPMDEVFDAEPIDDLPGALRAGLKQAADLGLVAVTEAGMRDWRQWDALMTLRERGELPIAVHVLAASGVAEDRGRLRAARDASDDQLALAGVKFYGDGWLGPRTCACSRPFVDVDPPDTGILFHDADRLARRLDPLASEGFRPATHAIGDRAIEATLEAYERVYGGAAGCRAARPRIEHAQLLRADLIARIVELGVVCCVQPCFASSDAGHLAAGLGDQFPEAYRWDLLVASGAAVVAGSDFPIETLDPQVGLEKLTTGPHPLAADVAMRLMTTPLADV